MGKIDEHFLLKRLNAGHYSAFTTLYEWYWEALFLYVKRLVRDEDEAEDIVQETFITIWELKGKLEHVRSFKAYALTIARNKALHYLRNTIETELIDDFISYLETHAPSALDNLIKDELALFVDNEVDNLPKRMKTTYVKSREDGLSNKEIAAIMGVSHETVKKQIHNSLKHLRLRISKFQSLRVFWFFF